MKNYAIILIALALVAALLAGCTANPGQSQSLPAPGLAAPGQAPPSSMTPAPGAVVPGTPALNDTKTSYDKTQQVINHLIADGVYANPVDYRSPGGQNQMTVSVTVANDVVTAVSLTPVTADPKSTMYMNNFNRNVQPLVVGKKINEIKLPHNVAGSSLTSGAFQQYIDSLLAKA